jgi:hypothetical protein
MKVQPVSFVSGHFGNGQEVGTFPGVSWGILRYSTTTHENCLDIFYTSRATLALV